MSKELSPAFVEARDEVQGVAAQTHGALSWHLRGVALACARCPEDDCPDRSREADGRCKLQRDFHADTFQRVLACEGVDAAHPAHRALAAEFAHWWTLTAIIDRWVSREGYFLRRAGGRLDPQPVLRLRSQASKHVRDLANQLMLSPAAQAKLGQKPSAAVDEYVATVRRLEEEDRGKRAG